MTVDHKPFKAAEDYRVEDNPAFFIPPRKRTEPHFHFNELGAMVKCYHGAKGLLTDWRFWGGMTFGFPFEHFLYEKVWPFTLLTGWLGL